MGYNPQIKPPMWAAQTNVARWHDKKGLPQPTLFLPMWERSGLSLFDLSGYMYHSTGFNSAPVWSGDGLLLDGTDDFVKLPDVGESTTALTVLCVLNTTATDNKVIFSHYETTTSNRAWSLQFASTVWAGVTGDELGVVLSTDGTLTAGKVKTYWGSVSGDEISIGKDLLVGFTWNVGTLKLYRENKEITTTKHYDDTFTTIHNSNSSISIGALNPDSGGVNFINANIKFAAIYNEVFSPAQWAEFSVHRYGPLYPISVPKYFFVSAAPPSFQAAWARNANTILQPGVF